MATATHASRTLLLLYSNSGSRELLRCRHASCQIVEYSFKTNRISALRWDTHDSISSFLLHDIGPDFSTHALAADALPEYPVEAGRQVIVEGEIWGGHIWHNGAAINDFVDADVEGEDWEDDSLPIIGGGLLGGIPIGQSYLLQLELKGEKTFYESNLADDNYQGAITGGGHIAYVDDQFLVGAFAAVGKAFVIDENDDDHDVEYYFGGIEGRVNFDQASLALQGGAIGADGVEDEHFDDGYFVRGIGQYFLNGGRTMIQADLGYTYGLQDYEADGFEDPIDMYSWGIEVEHAPDVDFGGNALSLFAAYEGLHIVEESDLVIDGNNKLTDHTFRIGAKIRFGATTPQEREMATAPDLPNVGRWQGATPAID